MTALPDLFPGFEARTFDTPEASIFARLKGSGPPLALLHGYPQTHAMWHRVVPALAEHFTCVLPDLRGYGSSSVPASALGHAAYSKRAMARDVVAVMAELGFDGFDVVGHDRGARVSYRLALDHPGNVRRVAVLDVIPTSEMYARTTRAQALAMWHWFFLPQPYDLPERLLAGDPEGFYFRGREDAFHPEALAEYQAALRDPAVIHTICEDYRAGATFDRELDEADKGNRRITCPLLALWGTTGSVARLDVLSVWREWAVDVRGAAIESGHHIPEDAPEATIAALREFLSG
jgi:haloacetate dehalogenase